MSPKDHKSERRHSHKLSWQSSPLAQPPQLGRQVHAHNDVSAICVGGQESAAASHRQSQAASFHT
jgi:hypothetical protein